MAHEVKKLSYADSPYRRGDGGSRDGTEANCEAASIVVMNRISGAAYSGVFGVLFRAPVCPERLDILSIVEERSRSEDAHRKFYAWRRWRYSERGGDQDLVASILVNLLESGGSGWRGRADIGSRRYGGRSRCMRCRSGPGLSDLRGNPCFSDYFVKKRGDGAGAFDRPAERAAFGRGYSVDRR